MSKISEVDDKKKKIENITPYMHKAFIDKYINQGEKEKDEEEKNENTLDLRSRRSHTVALR